MSVTLIVDGEQISMSDDVLDVLMLALNRWVDTGDIVVDDVDSETLQEAKAFSGELRLLLIRLAAEKKR